MLKMQRVVSALIGIVVFTLLARAPILNAAAEQEMSNCEFNLVPFGSYQCCLCTTIMTGTPPVVSCKYGPNGWQGVYSCTFEFCSDTGCPYEP